MRTNTKRITVDLDPVLHQAVQMQSARCQRALSTVLREALTRFAQGKDFIGNEIYAGYDALAEAEKLVGKESQHAAPYRCDG